MQNNAVYLKINSLKLQIKQHFETPLLRNSYYLMAGSLITSLIGFVSLIWAARFFTTEAIGLGSAALSALTLITTISELGLSISAIRYLAKDEGSNNELLNSLLTTSMIASLIIAMIFLAGIRIWSPALIFVRESPVFLMTFIFFVVVTTLHPIIVNTFLAKRQSQYIVIINITAAALRLVMIVIFGYLMNNALGFFIGPGIAVMVGLILAAVIFLPRVIKDFKFRPLARKFISKEIWQYSISNYIARLILLVPPSILSLFVVNHLGPEKNAYMYIALSIATILWLISTSSFNSLFAEVSNDQTSLKSNTLKSLKQMLWITIPSTVFTILIASPLLSLFGQAYSVSGTLLLRLFAAASIPWGIIYLYVSIARTGKNMGNVIKLTSFSQGLSLLLSYLLMQKMDIVGVGVGYLTGQSIAAAIVAILLFRKYYRRPSAASIK
jgi:O-antigen/teichoic acid export membrane protein